MRAEKSWGSVVGAGVLAGLDRADLDVAERLQARVEVAHGGIGLLHALADGLRARTIDDDRDDLFQRRPLLAHERGIEQREQNEAEAEGPEPDRALTQRQPERDDRDAGRRQKDQHQYRQQRRERQ